MTNEDMLTALLAQARTEGAELVTLRAIAEEAGELGANRALVRIGLSDEAASGDIDELRELLQAWRRVLEAASDLPAMPSDAQLEALHLMVWGARRYALLVELPPQRLQAVVAAQLDSCLRLLAGTGEISGG